MGTLSVFAATRPDEINRVYKDKLTGGDPRKGKGRAVNDDRPTPTDLARSNRRLIERVRRFSRFQAGFIDHNPEVSTSNRANQAQGLGDNTTRADARVVDATALTPEDEEPSKPVEVNDTPSSPTSNVEIPHNNLQMVEFNLGSSLSSARGENKKHLLLFKSWPRIIRAISKQLGRNSSQSTHQYRDNDGLYNGKNDKPTFGPGKDTKRKEFYEHNYFVLKERVDLSCSKLDLVNKNVTTTGENQLHTLSEITEVKDIVFRLSKALALDLYDAKKEKIEEGKDTKRKEFYEHNHFVLKERVDLSCSKLDLVNKNVTTTGENQLHTLSEITEVKDMVFRLSKALALDLLQSDLPALPPSTPSSQGIQPPSTSRGDKHVKYAKKSDLKQRMTKIADGRLVLYVPYVQGSGEQFNGNNIPSILMNKDNQARQDFHWAKNKAI
nr:ribosomal RNA processing protein 36 homolog [Ipomoea batatas]